MEGAHSQCADFDDWDPSADTDGKHGYISKVKREEVMAKHEGGRSFSKTSECTAPSAWSSWAPHSLAVPPCPRPPHSHGR